MALIKCVECGKEISDSAEKCIHCGCPIEKKQVEKNKRITVCAIVGCVLIATILVFVLINQGGKSIFPHTIKNTQLMKLMEYTSSVDIKRDLGDNYEHRVWDSLDSTSDEYEDIVIDGKEYVEVEISYKSDGNYKRIYLGSNSSWTEGEYKILVKDFIEQYGNEYDYREDEYNGNAIYYYSWEMSLDRGISLSIHQSSDDKDMYWVRINSFHN